MGKGKRKFVAKALPDGTWRIWNTKTKRWWGEVYHRIPDELLAELNGAKENEAVIEKNRDLQIERRPPEPPERITRN